MAVLDAVTDLERQRFFDGQRLFAADLQFLVDTLRRSNERHNELLHSPGIAKGFAVEGVRGDREIIIGPGLALDSKGHEIVLVQAHKEQLPAVDGDQNGRSVFYDLTVSYPADQDLKVAETRLGLCDTHGAVRLQVEPVFCWVRLARLPDGTLEADDDKLRADIQESRKVRVARVEILHCALESLSTAERRSARPPTRPHIRCGRAQPDWRVELFPSAQTPQTLFLLADIDTTSGEFLTPPCYFARLTGPRILSLPIRGDDVVSQFAADGMISIEEPAEARFTARVMVHFAVMGQQTTFAPPGIVNLAAVVHSEEGGDLERRLADAFAPWGVEWMGLG
jgi:hypothetical protein